MSEKVLTYKQACDKICVLAIQLGGWMTPLLRIGRSMERMNCIALDLLVRAAKSYAEIKAMTPGEYSMLNSAINLAEKYVEKNKFANGEQNDLTHT